MDVKNIDPCKPCLVFGAPCEQCMFGYRPIEENRELLKEIIEKQTYQGIVRSFNIFHGKDN